MQVWIFLQLSIAYKATIGIYQLESRYKNNNSPKNTKPARPFYYDELLKFPKLKFNQTPTKLGFFPNWVYSIKLTHLPVSKMSNFIEYIESNFQVGHFKIVKIGLSQLTSFLFLWFQIIKMNQLNQIESLYRSLFLATIF